MKKFLIAVNIVIWSFVGYQATAHAEVKKVCHIDAKTKKEVCKTIKTHKKVEGTKVPEKAPKK
jgi:formylmethanofuran:tetrahydromethanopterin formyltransferase